MNVLKIIGGSVLFVGTLIGSAIAGKLVGEGVQELMDN